MTQIVLAFDLYGTLLSTESIAKQLAEHFGPELAQSTAALWRRYQLEYTWRLNSMGLYKPFSVVTRNSLAHALHEHALALDQEETDRLMDAYNRLGVFPDVPTALDKVSSNQALKAVVFSNGTAEMVSHSVMQSKDLASYAQVFDDLVTLDEVQQFKPARAVYEYLAQKVGKEDMSEMWLVSGNPFDVMGAVNAGMKAAWVDRTQRGWMDAMDPDVKPTIVANDLNGVLDAIQKTLG